MDDVLHEFVLPRLDGVKPQNGSYMARCPAHEDSKPSLSITAGKTQPVVFNCHAGCDPETILKELGLTWEQLCAPRDEQRPRGEWTPHGEAVAVYDYVDESGTLLFQVLRTADKSFPQRIPDPSRKSGWTWKLGNTRRVLYRLPNVIEAIANGDNVWVCEGEKDVHALESLGVTATCNPGGAGSWRSEYAESLREADVYIVADKDEPGQLHARQVAASLDGVANSVEIVEAAGHDKLKDPADHVNAGYKLHEFVTIRPSSDPVKPDLAPDIWEFLAVDDPPYQWIVPDLLERGDRLMITGIEGLGKSMLNRQLAACISAGLNPFSLKPINPSRVLYVDCENTERQGRRKFRPLAQASIVSQHRIPDGFLRIIHRPGGIDLTSEDDSAWLMERVVAHRPDVLFIGPFYKLHATDMNEEMGARKTVAVLDGVRERADCALVMEAHAGHAADASGAKRSVRPIGSSLLLRWPEFGFGIVPLTDEQPCKFVKVQHWRGARDERDWPTQLKWGNDGEWPWVDPRYSDFY